MTQPLDAFRKSKEEITRGQQQAQQAAQRVFAKQVEQKEKKDSAKSWREKLVGFATLGGRIKPDTSIVVHGKVKNANLYMNTNSSRLNVSVDANKFRGLHNTYNERLNPSPYRRKTAMQSMQGGTPTTQYTSADIAKMRQILSTQNYDTTDMTSEEVIRTYLQLVGEVQ